jgi:hypothetical protein
MKKYNTYGNPIDVVLDNIRTGNTVEYIDARTVQMGKRKETVYITLQGIWDGLQVQFDDKEETLIKTKEWLKLASKCQKCNRKF